MAKEIRFNYSKKSAKFFHKHEDIRERFKADFERIMVGEHPEKVDYKRLKGRLKGYYRIRIGDYRVIFTFVNGEVIIVSVLDAGSRGDIYK